MTAPHTRALVVALATLLVTAGCREFDDFDETGGALDHDCPVGDFDSGGDEIDIVVAHEVSASGLDEPCLGDSDPNLDMAWEVLSTVVPSDELTDLALLAGFRSDGDGENETLAYVVPLDDDRTAFQMTVNLDAAAEDQNELRLTLLHEFSHIFSEAADQYVDGDDCDGWAGIEGCHPPGSWLADWVAAFWSDDDLATLEKEEPDPQDGDERCSLDPAWLGPYAASSPEEDFAETFSAFVLDVEAPGLEEKFGFFAGTDLAREFRENARAAGLTPATNSFDPCG